MTQRFERLLASSTDHLSLPPLQLCSYQDMQMSLALAQGDCRLQFQGLAQPQLGWPPAVIAKGQWVPFMGGSSLAVTGPELPGYSTELGSGLWGQPGYNCPGSLE